MPNIVVEGRKGDGEESNSAEMKIQNIEVNTNSYRRSSEGKHRRDFVPYSPYPSTHCNASVAECTTCVGYIDQTCKEGPIYPHLTSY